MVVVISSVEEACVHISRWSGMRQCNGSHQTREVRVLLGTEEKRGGVWESKERRGNSSKRGYKYEEKSV